MGVLRIKSAFSYGLLCGSALWAFAQSYGGAIDLWTCSNIAFALVALHGMFGFWKYGRSNNRNPVFYKAIAIVTTVYTVPLICVDMYLYNMFSYKLAYCHLVYPAVSLVPYIKKRKPTTKSLDLANFVSLTSFSIVSAMSKNYMGLIATFVYAFLVFVVRRAGKIYGIDARHWQNILMSCFVFFALKTLVVAELCWALRLGQMA